MVTVFVTTLADGLSDVYQRRNSMPQLRQLAASLPPNYTAGNGLIVGVGNIVAQEDVLYSEHNTTPLLNSLFRMLPLIVNAVLTTNKNLSSMEEAVREKIKALSFSFTGAPSSSLVTARACIDHLGAVFHSQRMLLFWMLTKECCRH